MRLGVIYGDYPSREQANAALAMLGEISPSSRPYVRAVAKAALASGSREPRWTILNTIKIMYLYRRVWRGIINHPLTGSSLSVSMKNCAYCSIPGFISLALLLCACTPTTLSKGPSAGHLQADSVCPDARGQFPSPFSKASRYPGRNVTAKTETYSVVVNNVQVHDLLFALARDARLNVDIHPGLTGLVTLNAIDQTLPQLLTRIAKQVDMRFEMDGPNLVVMPDSPYLKNYKVDYVNIARDVTGTVSTSTQISTSSLTTGGGGAAGTGNTSRIQIDNKSKNRFWETLEKEPERTAARNRQGFPGRLDRNGDRAKLITEHDRHRCPCCNGRRCSRQPDRAVAGRPVRIPRRAEHRRNVVKHMTFREAASVIANPEGGVITVRATARQHEKVQEFLDRVMSSARRQVLIEATIIEVTLSDGYQQGIEWSRLTSGTDYSINKPTLTTNVPSAVTPYVIKYRRHQPAESAGNRGAVACFWHRQGTLQSQARGAQQPDGNAQGF
jgi:hypothetical protein